MKVTLNNECIDVAESCLLSDIAKDFEIFVVNGYGAQADRVLLEGDNIYALSRGEALAEDLFCNMVLARNGTEYFEKMQKACVCICGLGGLGSNVAEMLTRSGIGRLILADFDRVDPTNLNRQNYVAADIGCPKTEATARHLREINPKLEITMHAQRVNAENILQIAEGASVVVEAFDDAAAKAEVVSTVLSHTKKYVVSASGMAGLASGNDIKTRRAMSRLYVCGDGVSDVTGGISLYSPRVNICAGHQANMVLRILLGELDS